MHAPHTWCGSCQAAVATFDEYLESVSKLVESLSHDSEIQIIIGVDANTKLVADTGNLIGDFAYSIRQLAIDSSKQEMYLGRLS